MYNGGMFRESFEIPKEENISEAPEENTEADPEQKLEIEEPFLLNEELQKIVRDYFEKKEFEVLEITDAHVKVKSPQGGEMTIPNKIAVETVGGRNY